MKCYVHVFYNEDLILQPNAKFKSSDVVKLLGVYNGHLGNSNFKYKGKYYHSEVYVPVNKEKEDIYVEEFTVTLNKETKTLNKIVCPICGEIDEYPTKDKYWECSTCQCICKVETKEIEDDVEFKVNLLNFNFPKEIQLECEDDSKTIQEDSKDK